MNSSKVYIKLNFLLHLKDAAVSVRKTLLSNMTSSQMDAIVEVAKRVTDGTVHPARRDVRLFERKQILLRSLASDHVSFSRKKTLLRRHHSLVPVLLRTVYLMITVLDEIRTIREA